MKLNLLLNKPFYALLALIFIFSSCDEDEPTPDDEIEVIESDSLVLKTVNVLIFHEGGFMANNATIGAYQPGNNVYNPTAFKSVNGSFIGDVQQSAILYNGNIYSVLNGSNVIKVMDSTSLEVSATIQDAVIDKPQDMVVYGNTGYISTWGPYADDFSLTNSRIVTVDIKNNNVTGSFKTEEGLEDMQVVGNQLLVIRNYFDSFKNLTFINLDNNSIDGDIELPAGPKEILVDSLGGVWVVCNSGAFVKVDEQNRSIEETIDLSGAIFGDADIYNGFIYFLQDNNVKKWNIRSGEISTVLTTTGVAIPYAFAVDPVNGEIYIGDGVDYAGEGKVLHYSAEGDLIKEFTSGIFPSQFMFQTELQLIGDKEGQ